MMASETLFDPFAYWSRAMAGWRMIGETAARVERTATDSRTVIAARSTTIENAMLSPWTADTAELSRMVPEKVAAFSLSTAALADAWWKAQADYAAEVQHVAVLMLRPRPLTLIELGELASRSAAFGMRMFEANARLGRDMLQPVQRSASANAKRLRRADRRHKSG